MHSFLLNWSVWDEIFNHLHVATEDDDIGTTLQKFIKSSTALRDDNTS